MNRFINFIEKIKQSEKACFIGKVLFFYLILMAIWGYSLLSKDPTAPVFIYEQF